MKTNQDSQPQLVRRRRIMQSKHLPWERSIRLQKARLPRKYPQPRHCLLSNVTASIPPAPQGRKATSTAWFFFWSCYLAVKGKSFRPIPPKPVLSHDFHCDKILLSTIVTQKPRKHLQRKSYATENSPAHAADSILIRSSAAASGRPGNHPSHGWSQPPRPRWSFHFWPLLASGKTLSPRLRRHNQLSPTFNATPWKRLVRDVGIVHPSGVTAPGLDWNLNVWTAKTSLLPAH